MRALALLALAACGDDLKHPDAAIEDAACTTPIEFAPTKTVPSIELLIDRSGSMAAEFGGVSRYQAVRDALVGPAGVITTLDGQAQFGATLFTTDVDGTCPRLDATPRALGNLAAIGALIDSLAPAGNTPSAESLQAVAGSFIQDPPPLGSPPIIVIATDGAPNACDGADHAQARSVQAVIDAYALGIRTFVLGVDDTVSITHLQVMANAGVGVIPGQPDAPFFSAADPQQLTTAFGAILDGVLTCELALSARIDRDHAASGTVTLNGELLDHGTEWTLVGLGSTLRLLGAACDKLVALPEPLVRATFPCVAIADP